MKKSLLVSIVTIVLILTLMPLPVFAQNENEQGIPDPGTPPNGVAVKMFIHYKKNSEKTSSIIAPASNESYIFSGYKWSDPNGSNNDGIPFYINFNYPIKKSPTLTQAAVRGAIDESFNTWVTAQIPDADKLLYKDMGTIAVAGGKRDGKNVISWKALSRGTIAVTYVWYNPTTKAILEFDMLYNTAYSWSVTSPTINPLTYDPIKGLFGDPSNPGIANTFDLQNIVTHEAGHTLMLNDLYEAGSENLTMFGYSDYAELNKDTLQHGDFDGLNFIY